MTVSEALYKSTLTLPSKKNKAFDALWQVTFRDKTNRNYHILVLRAPGKVFGSTTSVFVTDQIPQQADLTLSALHVEKSKDVVIKDFEGNIQCQYDPKKAVDLGFKVDDAEFKKTNSISPELIKKLGDFLINYLNSDIAIEDPDANKQIEDQPKSLIVNFGSSLINRVISLLTCNVVGVLSTITVFTSFYLYVNRDSQ